jgi:hypothetical protein
LTADYLLADQRYYQLYTADNFTIPAAACLEAAQTPELYVRKAGQTTNQRRTEAWTVELTLMKTLAVKSSAVVSAVV